MRKINLLTLVAVIVVAAICMAFISLRSTNYSQAQQTDIFSAELLLQNINNQNGMSGDIPFRHIMIDPFPLGRLHCKTVGDIDGDRYPDILAGDDAGEGLFWYKWPEWSSHRIDNGHFSTDMQVGDIDNDGDLDVIIPKRGSGLSWYENPRPDGNPVEESWRIHKVDSEGAHDVEVEDINNDGKLDIIVRTGTTRVYWQNSPDNWTKTVIETGGRGGTALGDLDGDGDLDIAQNGYWLENPGKPGDNWERYEIASGWPSDISVLISDINGDRRPDVLMVPAEEGGKLVWYETEKPKQGPWIEHLIADNVSHIHTFKTTDFDKDGHPDVVVAEMEQSPQRRIMIFYNKKGKGLEWQQQIVSRFGSHNIRLADIGNDRDIDIVGANHGNIAGPSGIGYWENLSKKPADPLTLDHWKRFVIDPDRPWRAVFINAADLDSDGKKDIITGAWWYRNPGTDGGTWNRNVIGEPFEQYAEVYDIDGDGNLDLLGTEGNQDNLLKVNPAISWAHNNGKGEFNIMTNIPSGEGDFLQGAVLYRPGIGGPVNFVLSWHKGGTPVQMITATKKPDSGTWESQVISNLSQLEQLSVGHLVNNTSLDIILGTKWLQKKESGWALHTLNNTPGDPDRSRLADMNGDGKLDVVVGFEAISIPGKLAWYECPEDPITVWKQNIIDDAIVGPMSLSLADMDRDGDFDVVVGEHNYKQPESAKLHIYENVDGHGTQWKDHIVFTGDEHHDGAIVTDIDNDGDFDIISIGWYHNHVLLYENLAQ